MSGSTRLGSGPYSAEVRLDDDGELDEVCIYRDTAPWLHLERLGAHDWCLTLDDARGTVLHLGVRVLRRETRVTVVEARNALGDVR